MTHKRYKYGTGPGNEYLASKPKRGTPGRYGTMNAADLFAENMRQVFDRKTGAWVATIRVGEQEPDQAEVIEVILPQEDKNQLTLF